MSQTINIPKKPSSIKHLMSNVTESNLIISKGSGDLGQHFSQTHVPAMLDLYLPYDVCEPLYDPENRASCRNQILARRERRARRKERLNNLVGTNSASYVSNSQLNDLAGGGAQISAVDSGAQISPTANHKSEVSGSPVQQRGEIFVGNHNLGGTKLKKQDYGS